MSNQTCEVPEGCIELDTPAAEAIGFTSARFGGGSYLWRRGECVYVSFIESLERGNFRALVETLLAAGLTVKVPTPLGRMQQIVRKAGFTCVLEWSVDFGEWVEVWVKHPVEAMS